MGRQKPTHIRITAKNWEARKMETILTYMLPEFADRVQGLEP